MSTDNQYHNADSQGPTAAQLRQTCQETADILFRAQNLLQKVLSGQDQRQHKLPENVRRGESVAIGDLGTSSSDFGATELDSYLLSPNIQHDAVRDISPPVPRPSCFCLDIIELEGIVRQQLISQAIHPEAKQQSLDTLVQKMLRVVISKSYWGWTRQWYTETVGFERLEPITKYRIAPTAENYLAIPPEFRPTELQLTRFHWPSVDWFPYPGIRDKLILHANEIDLTDVMLTSMRSYCLETQILESVEPMSEGTSSEKSSRSLKVHQSKESWHQTGKTPLHSIPVYYRLTEYITFVNQPLQSTPTGLDPPAMGNISKAVEAEFVLALRERPGIFKLEMTFFERFPLLYCEEALVKGTYRPLYDDSATAAPADWLQLAME